VVKIANKFSTQQTAVVKCLVWYYIIHPEKPQLTWTVSWTPMRESLQLHVKDSVNVIT